MVSFNLASSIILRHNNNKLIDNLPLSPEAVKSMPNRTLKRSIILHNTQVER